MDDNERPGRLVKGLEEKFWKIGARISGVEASGWIYEKGHKL